MSEINYRLQSSESAGQIPAPVLSFQPRRDVSGQLRIGLVGCGGIASTHLEAYRKAGYQVTMICSRSLERAEKLRQEYFPAACVSTQYQQVLQSPQVDIVDLTAHPLPRARLIEQALQARRHVLSQKPFVVDLNVGQRLVDLAESQGLKLAVNQNGRWAPHFAYLRELVRTRLLGHLEAVRLEVHWDHNWISELAFNRIQHVLLYDFAIHWFDFLASLIEQRAERLFASVTRAASQRADPPLLAQVTIDYRQAQASVILDANTRQAAHCRSLLIGSQGSALSHGPDILHQEVVGHTPAGWFRPELVGRWFPDGFHGAMAELMHAIEQGGEPLNGARGNLESLALCFAAVASADTHQAHRPWTVTALPASAGAV